MLKELILQDKSRYMTAALLLVAVGIAIASDSFFVIWALLGIGYIFAFYEALQLFGIKNNSIYAYAVGLWLLCYVYPFPSDLLFLLMVIFGGLLAYRKDFDKKLFLPILYPAASFLFLLTLYKDFGPSSLIWLLVVVAMTDIAAYYAGRLAGKTPFCETSPNKTIEGVVAGIAGGSLVGMVVGHVLVDTGLALLISFLVSLAAVFGDLFESYLKRQADVKDSGNLFPGHGGVLDRLDGYLFGCVVMVIALRGLV